MESIDVQGLPESSPTINQLSLQYAGFWRRVAASFFDNAVTTLIGLGFVIVLVIFNIPVPQIVSDVAPLIFFWLYFSLMESSEKQATVGKRILGIRVTDINGGRISFLRATGRTFGKFISMIIVGIGFLMVAFTKRKQGLHDMIAKTLVVTHGESRIGKAILISFTSFLLIIGIVGVYSYFVLLPRLTKMFSTAITVISEPTKISDIEPLPEKIVLQPKVPTSLTLSEYDALLSKPISGLSGTSVGPAILKLSNFWDGESPKIWIEVMLPVLPNFNLGYQLTKITINSVQGMNGKNIYDRESSFEGSFFQSFSTQERSNPFPHLSGIRSVQLMGGTKKDDIMRIDGKLILELPLNIQEISFTKEDLKKEKKINDITVIVNAIENNQVLWSYQGDGNNYIGIKAYNMNGKELKSDASTYPSRIEYKKPADLKGLFNGDIALVKIFITQQIVERIYPFILSK